MYISINKLRKAYANKKLLDSEGQRFWVDDYGTIGDAMSYDDEAVIEAVDAAKKIGGE